MSFWLNWMEIADVRVIFPTVGCIHNNWLNTFFILNRPIPGSSYSFCTAGPIWVLILITFLSEEICIACLDGIYIFIRPINNNCLTYVAMKLKILQNKVGPHSHEAGFLTHLSGHALHYDKTLYPSRLYKPHHKYTSFVRFNTAHDMWSSWIIFTVCRSQSRDWQKDQSVRDLKAAPGVLYFGLSSAFWCWMGLTLPESQLQLILLHFNA